MAGSFDTLVTVSGRVALPLVAGLRASGRDVAGFLERLGLDEATLGDLRTRLTMEAFLELHAASMVEAGDRGFPLRAVRHLDREAFPLGFYMFALQPTLRDSMHAVRPYGSSIVDGLDFHLVEQGPLMQATFEIGGAPLRPPIFAEYYVALALSLGRLMLPDGPPPIEVIFPHRWPRHVDAPDDLYGAPVRFGGEAVRMVFEKPRLDSFVLGSDPALAKLLAQSVEQQIVPHPPHERLRNRAHRFLVSTWAEGEMLSTRDLGRALKVSARTLRRRLQAEGTSVSDLVEEVRREGALQLLERGPSTMDEIAFRLGFSGASAFRRAFKRWTGKSPAAFVTAPPGTGRRR